MRQFFMDTLCITPEANTSDHPVGTRRNNNVFTTSTRRRQRRVDVVKTLSLRHYCVMCPLGSNPGTASWQAERHPGADKVVNLQCKGNT